MDNRNGRIGVIGGTGFDVFPELEIIERIAAGETPYGFPSDDLLLARFAGQEIIFVPRHGSRHQHAPSRVPYKANLAAMKALGVQTVVATCIVGSLKKQIAPGHFVVPDQFVHFTSGRDGDSIEQDGSFIHLSTAEPYCTALRDQLVTALRQMPVQVHDGATTVVIQGPRFSTKAESRFFMRNDWDIVNMTQYPECVFARELGVCYAVMASVTDWDAGVDSCLSMQPENMDLVLETFHRNTTLTKLGLGVLLQGLRSFQCGCAAKTVTEYYKRG